MFKLKQSSITANPYLTGNFAPIMDELTVNDLKVRGTIPEELNGRLLRIGPNPITPPDPNKHHWFIGNGMVHGIEIRNGQAVSYRNRFVVDSRVAAALKRPPIGGPTKSKDRPVNTNVIAIDGRIFALVEAGALPIELDKELKSVQRSDFNQSLKAGYAAHPHKDPNTGELHALAYQAGSKDISYIVVGKSGIARSVASISTNHSPLIHDTAITTSYVIVLDLPVSFDLGLALSGRGYPYKWNEKIEPRIGLLPREGVTGTIEWVTAPSCFVFHILNAFEDNDKVIIDVVKHPKMFDKNLDGPREGETMLARWTIDLKTKKVSETVLYDGGVEFPRMNESLTGSAYRFGYTAKFAQGINYGSIYKHDVVAATTEEHDFGVGMMSGEPVFVPRESSSKEDSGWILSCVFNEMSNKSEVHILDAERFYDEAVAVVELPARIPFGFHGNWISDSELS